MAGESIPTRMALIRKTAILICVFAPAFFFWLLNAKYMRFNSDEMEHAHAVYLLDGGKLPYRDFFEHHAPLVYYAAEPVYRVLGPVADSLVMMRLMMIACLLIAVFSSAAIVRSVGGRESAGLLSAVGFAYLVLVARTGIEFRPDPPGIACGMLGIAVYLSGKGLASDAVSALLWGLAGAFTPKAIYPFAGLSIFHAVRLFTVRKEQPVRAWASLFLWPMLSALPFLLTALFFAMQAAGQPPEPWYSPSWVRALPGSLPVFLDRTIFWNTHWANRFHPFVKFIDSFIENAPFWLLAFGGGWLLLRGALRDRKDSRAAAVIFPAAGALIGAFLVPVPYSQYILWIAAFWSAPMGVASERLYDRMAGLDTAARTGWRRTAVFALFAIVLVLLPSMKSTGLASRDNLNQREAIQFFREYFPPNAKVMDGWTGFSVFMPSAWYYHILHLEIRAMIPQAEQERGALAALDSAQAVIRDKEIDSLPEPVKEKIEKDFVPFSSVIWLKKGFGIR